MAAVIGLTGLSLPVGWADPPEATAEKPTRADQDVPESRPVMQALLKGGKTVEGRLFRFADGVYIIRVDGKYLSVFERDIEKLTFRPAKQEGEESLDKVVEEFQKAGRDNLEPFIARLAAQGPAVIDPLLAIVAKNSGTYQAVGKVFQQIGPEIYPQLIERVRKDPTGYAAYPTTWAIRESGPASYPILEQILVDKDPRIRRIGRDVLHSFSITSGSVVPKSFVPTLLKLLDDPDHSVSDYVPHILARVESDQVVPALLETLTLEKRQHLHLNTVLALKHVASELEASDADLPPIVACLADAALNSGNEHVRGYAVWALGDLAGKTKDPDVLAALKRAASDKRESVRKYADEALAKFGIRKAVADAKKPPAEETPREKMDRLIAELASGDSNTSRAARVALEAIVPDEAVMEALMQAVREDKRYSYWPTVAYVIGHWDAKAKPLLGRYVKDENPLVRRTVAVAWVHMTAEQLPDDLRTLTKNSDDWARTSALDTLATLSQRPFPKMREAIVPLLIEGLADEHMHREYWWRIAAAVRECGPNHPEVVPGLVKLMRNSKNEGFRQTAAGELGYLGHALRADDPSLSQIVKALVQAMNDETDERTRVSIIWAIAYMGTKGGEALPALKKAQDDPYQSVAKAASDAATKVGGGKVREPDPFE